MTPPRYGAQQLPPDRVFGFLRAALATFGRHGIHGDPAAYSSSSRSRIKYEWIEAVLEANQTTLAAADAAAAEAQATGVAVAAQGETEQASSRIVARVRQTLTSWFR